MEEAMFIFFKVLQWTHLFFQVIPRQIFRTFKWKSESQDIWNLLREISPRHIVQDIMFLKSVKTDIGRIRAWIRVTINESTLQSYIQLLTDSDITK